MPRIPTNRKPTTPGEVIREEFLKPLGLTQVKLAERLGITHARLSEIIHGHRSVTPDTALRLARVLGPSPAFWLNLQQDVERYEAMHAPSAKAIARLQPIEREAVLA